MSTADAPVLVTGATGRQGGAVVRALRAADIAVRAMVRDASRTVGLRGPGVEVVVGDLDDPPTVARAVEGARGVFSVQLPRATPDGLDHVGEMHQARTLVEASLQAGVDHFVQSSISGSGQHAEAPEWVGTDWGSTAKMLDTKAAIQVLVRSAGFVHWTIVKPGTFMENFAPGAAYLFPRGLEGGLVTTLRPDTRLSLTAVDDIGTAVAMAFTHPGRFDQVELELASDHQSMTEVAATLSRALGVTITAPQLSEQEAVAAGMPPIGAAHRWLNECGQPARPEYARALGISLTTFEEWAHAHLEDKR